MGETCPVESSFIITLWDFLSNPSNRQIIEFTASFVKQIAVLSIFLSIIFHRLFWYILRVYKKPPVPKLVHPTSLPYAERTWLSYLKYYAISFNLIYYSLIFITLSVIVYMLYPRPNFIIQSPVTGDDVPTSYVAKGFKSYDDRCPYIVAYVQDQKSRKPYHIADAYLIEGPGTWHLRIRMEHTISDDVTLIFGLSKTSPPAELMEDGADFATMVFPLQYPESLDVHIKRQPISVKQPEE